MEEAVGHLDFYPNGGADQPGCNEGMMKHINQEKGSFFKGKHTVSVFASHKMVSEPGGQTRVIPMKYHTNQNKGLHYK